MKTQDLIALLAADAKVLPTGSVTRRFASTLVAGLVIASALVWLIFGLNTQIPSLTGLMAFWLKEGWLLALGVFGWATTQRLSRPAGEAAWPLRALAAAALLMFALGLLQWLQADPAQRDVLWRGATWRQCTVNITLLTLPLLAALLWTVRDLAPTQPRLAGASAGLTAGAWAALAYSLHCPEMDYTFLALWYGGAIALAGGLGALLGGRWLRW